MSFVKDLQFTHFALRYKHQRRRAKYGTYGHTRHLETSADKPTKIDEDLGYAVFDGGNNSVIKRAIACAESLYSPDIIQKKYREKGGKGPFCVIDCDNEDPESQPIFDLAEDEYILEPVRQYLNATPVIVSVQVWFSPNNSTLASFNSQLFHFDREDYKQIKCFVPIHTIDEQCGPMTIIPKSATARFVNEMWKKGKIPSTKSRYDDSIVEKIIPNEEVTLCGPPGAVLMADTTQCLHFGSRTATRPKYHLSFQFLTPYSYKLDKVRDKISKDLANSPRFASTY